MQKRWVLMARLGMFILFMTAVPSYAQKQPSTLTILFTNNINGEIEPCPT